MGPLEGVRVVELAGLGAAPFGCMLLADLGAEVVRVERAGPADRRMAADDAGRAESDARRYVPHRGRRSVALNLKAAGGREALLRLVERADVLVEAYRPGGTERLGLGPDDCLGRNPRLVYARITGWGQTGPLAPTAGHDINYIAVAGALDNFRRSGERPLPPVNLVGDMGGGGMLLAFGITAALLHVARTGEGRVWDPARATAPPCNWPRSSGCAPRAAGPVLPARTRSTPGRRPTRSTSAATGASWQSARSRSRSGRSSCACWTFRRARGPPAATRRTGP